MAFMKKRLPAIFFIAVIVLGFAFLLYPTISDWYNTNRQSRTIVSYAKGVAELDEKEVSRILHEAYQYNAEVARRPFSFLLPEGRKEAYAAQLDLDGTGVMGYIGIPDADISLPIYHGTDEAVLQIAVGHIEGSSLPVAGESGSSHCVLSGHRGLPSAKLFTNIDKLSEGSRFHIVVMNTKFTYEVFRILTVDPEDASDLKIEDGQDYCTLVTCTPYGVNTHRLLVMGRHIDTELLSEDDTNEILKTVLEKFSLSPLMLLPVIVVICLLILMIILRVRHVRKKRKASVQSE